MASMWQGVDFLSGGPGLLAPYGRGVSADPASDQTPPPTIRSAALVTMAVSRRGRVPGGPPDFVQNCVLDDARASQVL